MNRRRIYAIHYAAVIPSATLADYARDYYIDHGKARRVMRWLFYRQDAAGRVTVREYRDWPDAMGMLDTLTAAGIPLEIGDGGTWKFEVWRRYEERDAMRAIARVLWADEEE